jgi:hypothetical protein
MLLALDMVSRRLSRFTWEKLRYYLRFWIPLRKWVWSKIPETPDEKWDEFRSKAWDKVTETPEKKEILDYQLPYLYKESSWEVHEIVMKRKKFDLLNEVRREERKLFIQHIMETNPWTKILFQIKFLR